MMREFTDSSDWQKKERETGICELFEIQVNKTPGLTAVWCNGNEITYQELNRRSGFLATLLKQTEPRGNPDRYQFPEKY